MNISANGNNWRLWCRLCTKGNDTNMTNVLLKTEERTNDILNVNNNHANKALVAAIEKYFPVNLRDDEGLPKSLCSECFTYVKNLMIFRVRVAKAQHFFFILQQAYEDTSYDANALRLKCGLPIEEVVVHSTTQQPPPEMHYVETKLEPNDDIQEENLLAAQTIIITDPLEMPQIKIENTETDKADGQDGESAQMKNASADKEEIDNSKIIVQCLGDNERENEHVDDIIFCVDVEDDEVTIIEQCPTENEGEKELVDEIIFRVDEDEEVDDETIIEQCLEESGKGIKRLVDDINLCVAGKEVDDEKLIEQCLEKNGKEIKGLVDDINLCVAGKEVDEETILEQCLGENEREKEHVNEIKFCSKRKKVNSNKLSSKRTPTLIKQKRKCSSNDGKKSNAKDTDENTTTAKQSKTNENNANTEQNSSNESETEGLLTCDECSIEFNGVQSYQKHVKDVHNKEMPKCPQRHKLRQHLLLHKEPLESRLIIPCPYCDKKFTTAKNVKLHINYIHERVTSFVCEECGEIFRLAAECRRHLLTHTGSKKK